MTNKELLVQKKETIEKQVEELRALYDNTRKELEQKQNQLLNIEPAFKYLQGQFNLIEELHKQEE